MARLSSEQWQKVKAKWVTGKYVVTDLASEFGVSHTAINKKAKGEGWIKIDGQTLDNAVKSAVAIKQEVSKVSKVSNIETKLIETEIDALAQFEIDSNRDLQFIQDQVNIMASELERPSDALALMTATVKHRESRLGKSPDTQVNIQNNADIPSQINLVAKQ